MDYFYGPVPSRRLGFSLGVDVTPMKACTFDCLYCQLGRSSQKTIRRFSYVNLRKFNRELRQILKRNPKIDYITFSGSGEPTLHKSLDKLIRDVKKITKNKYPVCVITNASLMYRKTVRDELKSADLVIPSLDAVTLRLFKKINRPHEKINLKRLIRGLKLFCKEFKGQVWLEVMLIRGINDSCLHAKKIRNVLNQIGPDKVQLNIPVRPSETKCPIPNWGGMQEIKEIIGHNAEVVNPSVYKRVQTQYSKDIKQKILKFLRVRPATLKDLTVSLGLNQSEILKHLMFLLNSRQVESKTVSKKKYFKAA